MLPKHLYYTDRLELESYLKENSLNVELNQWLCVLDNGVEKRPKLKCDHAELFNQAYLLCVIFLNVANVSAFYNELRYVFNFIYRFKNYECTVYECIAYAILSLQKDATPKMVELANAIRDKIKGDKSYFPYIEDIVTRRRDMKEFVKTEFPRKKITSKGLNKIRWDQYTGDYAESNIRLCVAECPTLEEKKIIIESIKKRFLIEYPEGTKLDFRQEEGKRYLLSAVEILEYENTEDESTGTSSQRSEESQVKKEEIKAAIRYAIENNHRFYKNPELSIRSNNPDFMHFHLYWSMQGVSILEFYLQDEINEIIYDTYLKARAEFEAKGVGFIYQESDESFDDSFYFDEAYLLCCQCWKRADPHKLIHPVMVLPGEKGVVNTRDYYWDICVSVVYVILSLQSSLPNVAVSLLSFIERRQRNDKYFFPAFKEKARELRENGFSYDVNFAEFMFPEHKESPNRKMDIANILDSLKYGLNSVEQLEIVDSFREDLSFVDGMSNMDRAVMESFLALAEETIKEVDIQTPSLYFKDYFLPISEVYPLIAQREIAKPEVIVDDEPVVNPPTEDSETVAELKAEIEKLKAIIEVLSDNNIDNDGKAWMYDSNKRTEHVVAAAICKLIHLAKNVDDTIEFNPTRLGNLVSYLTGFSYKKTRQIVDYSARNKRNGKEIKDIQDAFLELGVRMKID